VCFPNKAFLSTLEEKSLNSPYTPFFKPPSLSKTPIWPWKFFGPFPSLLGNPNGEKTPLLVEKEEKKFKKDLNFQLL